MKIAYYEENNYHTEIAGTFLDYFSNHDHDITVYNDADNSGYIQWFIKQVKFNLKKIDDFIIDYNDYDLIIIGTSYSFKYFKDERFNLNTSKIYFVNHLKEDIEINSKLNGFVLTPINLINKNLHYILPISNIYYNLNKNYSSKITIGIIGRFKDDNRNINDIIRLVKEYSHLNFEIKIFSRHPKFIPKQILKLINDTNKIKIIYKLPIEEIIKHIPTINYFCPLTAKNSCYIKDRLTGIIPFSINFNTPLLLDEETNKIYNLKTPIIYKDSICEIIEQIINMDKIEYLKLIEKIKIEKKQIIQNNNSIFDNIIDNINNSNNQNNIDDTYDNKDDSDDKNDPDNKDDPNNKNDPNNKDDDVGNTDNIDNDLIFPIIEKKNNNKIKSISGNNILILSTQYNRYGGAATCAYETHKYLLKNGINSVAIFFDNSIINDHQKYNIDNLPNVYACKLLKDYLNSNVNLNHYNEIKKIIDEKIGNDFIMLAYNYLAPLIGKLIFPFNTMYYMITGTCYINNTNTLYAEQIINEHFILEYNEIEKKSIDVSEYIIPNSVIMNNVIKNIYKITPDEIFDLHEIYENSIFNLKISKLLTDNNILGLNYFKKYDILFISSNLDRKVKNTELVIKIFLDPKLKKYKKLVIGKNSSKYFNNSKFENIEILDFLNQEQIINFLRQSKILLIPSYIESYSISCIEATNNTCIPLLSKNVGCNNFINNNFIIETYETNDWINKIIEINDNYMYNSKIFYNNYKNGNKILDILKYGNKFNHKKKVLFVCVDIPGNGGAATNTMNLINNLKDIWDIYVIFIDNNIEYKIENISNYKIIKNDVNIFDNLIEYKNEIEINKKIDFIFCKNYKSLIFIRNIFKNTNIIFSPSGIRYVGKFTNNDYIQNINLDISNKNIIYTDTKHKIDFIKKNDDILDFLAFNLSDIIIPNSKLSYDIINKTYVDEKKINFPIYTTNINYIKNINNNKNIFTREYDIIFCCYSWSRGCKNSNLVKILIDRCTDKKILLVGKNIKLEYNYNNLTYIPNIPNNEIKDYFKKVKVLVIPSFYDSNPNIFIEAISVGCNIVTSKNVGNSEFLNPNQIVNDPTNINEWIKKINNCLTIKYEYNGYDGLKIKNELLKITQNIWEKKSIVGIYKINPLWDIPTKPNFSYFTFVIKKNDDFVRNIVYNDIYFILTYKLGLTNKMNDINYIIIDETIPINECYYVYNSLSYYEDFVKIWKINNRDDIFFFNESNMYFLRGNYHNFYNIFISNKNKNKVIFYPATSFKQNIDIIDEPLIKNKYDIVLIHEDPKYNKVYKHNKRLIFNKFATDKFINNNIKRIYDFCFIATEKQKTKNHELFINFIEYLEYFEIKYNIIFVGNLEIITNEINYSSKFKHVKLTIKYNLSKNDLIKIYNQSKNNIIFSGRDAFPRVITESAACGCYNIALDTLCDGKSFFNNKELGILIGDEIVEKKIINNSLTYVSSKIIWNKIINEINKKHNPNLISYLYKKNNNVDNIINEINEILKTLEI